MSAGCQQIDARPCTPHRVTVAASLLWPCWDGGWAWAARCLLDIGRRGLAPSETNSRAGHYKYTAQGHHTHMCCHHDSSHTTSTHRQFTHMGLCIGPTWTGLSTNCGLPYQPRLPRSPQRVQYNKVGKSFSDIIYDVISQTVSLEMCKL